MDMQQNVPLGNYSTMRLGGSALHMVEVTTKQELAEAVEWAETQSLPVIVIGEGSNIVWRDEGYRGLVIVNKITGFEKLNEDETSASFQIGAGEDWDAVVGKLVDLGLSGVECLSLIPGKTGATPVQNVGAYGQEIAETLVCLEAYDREEKTFKIISNQECGFAYRNSRFKSHDKGRFFISNITLKLRKTPPKQPFYTSLQTFLDEHNVHDYTVKNIREAVIAIRSDKMPDWHKIANNGSFFANPIITSAQYEDLKLRYANVVAWPHEGGFKLSGGWLMETAGLRGFHDAETGMATSDKTALVFINEHAKSTADLLAFKQKITDKIKETFGIELVQEPELVP